MSTMEPRMEAELRRGTVQLVALTMLATPRYGYDLVRLLAEAGFDVEEGTLYPILRRLEQRGILESSWNTEGSRPRKYYRLSADGEEHRRALIEAWHRVRDATDAALQEGS
jgi:DNA-binding PadR family transcriptional regulator